MESVEPLIDHNFNINEGLTYWSISSNQIQITLYFESSVFVACLFSFYQQISIENTITIICANFRCNLTLGVIYYYYYYYYFYTLYGRATEQHVLFI